MANSIHFLASPGLVVISAILGLVVGSFLNVVIHRLPIMLERAWRAELEGSTDAADEVFNLAQPRSRCPHCGHVIRAIHNIPVLSYVALRGRCADCGARISPQYPLIELICAVLSAAVAWRFGLSPELAPALLLTWGLIALAGIDLHHHLLPDDITLPMLWLGLGLSLFGIFSTPGDSIIGAMAGYLSLWSLYHLFRLLTGKEGMGYGDFKLFALFGAWFGWQALPLVLILSALSGSVVGIALLMSRRITREVPIPFGPYLAGAGWIAMVAGDSIVNGYFSFAGLA